MTNKKQSFVFILFIFLLSGSILFTGCNQQKEKEEVDKAVMDFFNAYKQHNIRTINRQLLSTELADLVNRTVAKEDKEVEIVSQSDYPTDKPFMLDFDIFTSLTEGADSIKILSIQIKADTARVDVLFSNSQYNSYIEWNDRLVLIKKTAWKLDNVIYGEENITLKSLQDLLKDYIHADKTMYIN